MFARGKQRCNSFKRRLSDSGLAVKTCVAPLRVGFLILAGAVMEDLNGVCEQCVTNFLKAT